MVDHSVLDALRLTKSVTGSMTSSQIQDFLRSDDNKDTELLIISHAANAIDRVKPNGLSNRKHDARQWLDDFSEFWSVLQEDENLSTVRHAGLGAVEAAFILGCLVGEYGIGRTKAASQAKRTKSIDLIISRLAHEHWFKKPEGKAEPSATARAIYKKVFAEVLKLSDIPRGWEKCGQPEREAKVVDMIRQRVNELIDFQKRHLNL